MLAVTSAWKKYEWRKIIQDWFLNERTEENDLTLSEDLKIDNDLGFDNEVEEIREH